MGKVAEYKAPLCGLTGIHWGPDRGTAPFRYLALVYEVQETANMVRLLRRLSTNPKGGRRYGVNGPSFVPQRSIVHAQGTKPVVSAEDREKEYTRGGLSHYIP